MVMLSTDAGNDSLASPNSERVLVVSIDGLAPRAISRQTTPNLCAVARAGGGCFWARTVEPPKTLPTHTSMLRGVGPDDHGVKTNEPVVLDGAAPSFLSVARVAGLSTAAVLGWRPISEVIEPDATLHRSLLDGGYDVNNDAVVVRNATDLMHKVAPDVTFVYLTQPDLAGHAAGWDSEHYVQAVSRADAMLAELLDAAGRDVAVIVTTDHGGEGRDHVATTNETMETFVVVRSKRQPPGSCWETASILDVAPTVADLAGIRPSSAWTGRSLIGSSNPVADRLVDVLASLEAHSYGENVNMLAHSLQAAACAQAEGADANLILAALFHDVGHVLGEATEWGLPGHAATGARLLQPWFAASVVDPIRLHVAAKRFLVATDPAYLTKLSIASRQSLREQGGPFDQVEVDAFSNHPSAEAAISLRRWDDAGKNVGGTVEPLDFYRPLIAAALAHDDASDVTAAPISPMWARDACRCQECRDPSNGQHLIDATDLDGWKVTDSYQSGGTVVVLLEAGDGRRHRCVIPDRSHDIRSEPVTTWGHEHGSAIRRRPSGSGDAVDCFLADLTEYGIAIATNVPTTNGQVLRFAQTIGFPRTTNYGELFDVIADSEPTNLAYTANALPLHTDNPYRDPVPTVQLLHCLRGAQSGGGSIFSDGFRAAEQLRIESPEDFDLLSATPVSFRFVGNEVDLQATVPLITLDVSANVSRVTINNRSMEPPPPGPTVDNFYHAYRRFVAVLAEPTNTIEITLEPGEVVAFDNRRVLHGRRSFHHDPTRHLQGCYIDMDNIRSRLEVLRNCVATNA